MTPGSITVNWHLMNCWGIRIYFSKSRFSLNGGLFVYMELLSGHVKIITKSGISLNAGTLNRGFTVFFKCQRGVWLECRNKYTSTQTEYFQGDKVLLDSSEDW
jgi:hypothetical protein